MAASDNYLDIGGFFINEIIGDINLFIIISMIIILYTGLKYKLPFESAGIMLGIWLMGVGSYTKNPIIFTLVILIVGASFYSAMNKVMHR